MKKQQGGTYAREKEGEANSEEKTTRERRGQEEIGKRVASSGFRVSLY